MARKSPDDLVPPHSLIDGALHPISLVDPDTGFFVAFNRKACESLGYSQEEFARLRLKDVDLASAESAAGSPAQIDGPGSASYETKLITKSGDLRETRVFPARVQAAEKEYVQYVWIDMRDQLGTLEPLRQRERHYRSLFDNAHDAILVFRPEDEVVLEVNRRACEIYGYSRAELVGKSLKTISEDVPRGRRYVADTLQKGVYRGFETVQYRKDGSPMVLEVNASVISYHGREAILSVNRDITERKHVEQVLREARMRYDLATAAARVGVWDWNLETDEFYLDRNVKALLGYEDDEIPNDLEVWTGYVHPDDREPVMRAATSHLEGRTAEYSFEHRMMHKDGSVRWFDVRGHAIRDSSGKPIRFIGTDTDVTDRRRAEEALQASDEWHRRLIELGASVYTVSDEQGEVLYASPSVEHVYGWKPEEIVGDGVFRHAHPDDADRALEMFRWLVKNPGRPKTGEIRYGHKDGSWRTIQVSGVSLLRDPVMKGVILTSHDVTRLKRLEEERIILEAQVQQAQKLESLGVMAGGVAHDFNNLLTGILGNAGLALGDLSPSSTARRFVEQIENSALHAADLTGQLLAYSGKGAFQVSPLDLNELVAEMSHLMKNVISEDARLEIKLAEGVPAVEADATQVRQAVMNLVANASEALGNGNGRIVLRTGSVIADREFLADVEPPMERPEGTYATLEVSDTGVGMEEETTRRIFEPFFSTKFAGRGLGLAAVLGIVRSHRGAVKVASEPGVGTTITMAIPAANLPAQSLSKGTENAVAWRGSGTVLVVDDQECVRSVAEAMLESVGFDVLTAEGGREGVEVFRLHHEEIVAVLLDLTMPHMDGAAVFPLIREVKPDVPVVLMSGYSSDEATKRFAGKGLAGFLQKPYSSKELAGKLRRVMEPCGVRPSWNRDCGDRESKPGLDPPDAPS